MMPLHVDEDLEAKERGRLGHVMARWLKRQFPRLAYAGPPPGRRSVYEQLSTRARFPDEQWFEFGPQDAVLQILELIQRELAWPNHNFLPDDPLTLVMTGFDLDDVYALRALERQFGVSYSVGDVQCIINGKWTLGRFVRDVQDRSKVTQRLA
jgi:hypothetical protein